MTSQTLRRQCRTLIPAAVLALLCSPAFATGNDTPANAKPDDGRHEIYESHQINNNIFSYAGYLLGKLAASAQVDYVDKSGGQAIHSYPHAAAEKKALFDVIFVDTSSGQAIYGYDRRTPTSYVKILPLSEK